jgi:hypothetical protein
MMSFPFENASCILEDLDKDSLTNEYWDLSLQGGEVIADIGKAMLIILLLLAVPLNFYVIGKIILRKVYSEPTYMLLLNLCTADLLMCFVHFVPWIAMGFAGHFSFGNSDFERCQVCRIGMVFAVVNLVSALTVMVLSIDRCIYFVRPLRYHIHMTALRTGVTIIVIWAASIFFYVPAAMAGYGDIILGMLCGVIFSSGDHVQRSYFAIGGSAIVFSAIVVVLVLTNIVIIREVRKQQKMSVSIATTMIDMADEERGAAMDDTRQRQAREQQRREVKKQLKLLKVFGGILGVDFITLIPITILAVALLFVMIPYWYGLFVTLCLATQVVLHPLVEAFLAPEIQVRCTCSSSQNSNMVR